MASVPDVAAFLRKPRMGPTQKVRPIMKLEWNKLLAEATEKDKINQDKETNYDDENNDTDGETDSNTMINSEQHQDERPLNLCNKSHTMPIPGGQFLNGFGVLDLSSKMKKNEGKNSSKSNDHVKEISGTVPSFQCNKNLPEKNLNESENNKNAIIIENKENLICNNDRDIYSTPCNYKFGSHDKSHSNVDGIRSCVKNDFQEKHNLIFYSEKKPTPKVILSDRDKISKEEINIKLDILKRDGKIEAKEKVNSSNPNVGTKPPLVTTPPNNQKFAVPTAPSKSKESSKVLMINKKSYQILAPLGKGGSSKVYLVLNPDNELLAVKCVRLSDVPESTKNDYLNEIQHLMKMQHSKHVIRLYDHQYLSSQKILFAVMERGETDLSRFLKDKASSDEGISPELIMYYWTEMLMAVKSIHDNNIIHRDLKPANFLLVSGRLKLIDFGIASAIQTEQTSILMESQSGTFNYMSPEALQDLGFDNKIILKIGRKTDVWSLGCILYYFLYKKTPYQDLVKPLHKLKAITDPNYVVPFPKISGVPDILIESCKRCLVHDTKKRASIEELLALRNRPLFSLSQVLGKLEKILSPKEYKKAEEAFEGICKNHESIR